MRVLGVVTARGGSRRVPGKNIADLGGKPLIAWSIEVGLATCDKVVTSTDSDEIADVARQYGSAIAYRPAKISKGEPGMQMQAVLHAYEVITFFHNSTWDAILLLQPTSPFREEKDIATCFQMMEKWSGVESVVSVTTFPERGAIFTIGHAGRLRDVVDDGPKALGYSAFNSQPLYKPNGAIFLARTKHLLAGGDWFGLGSYAYVIPHSRSVDIDTHHDFEAARAYLATHEVKTEPVS